MSEQAIVQECLREIFARNGYVATDHLTQRDFDHISERIEETTGILISGTTIRRLLNGKFSRLPQIATLDAIARHLDYKNWQACKVANMSKEAFAAEETHRTDTAGNGRIVTTFRKMRGVLAVSLGVGLVAIVGFMQLSEKTASLGYETATFTARKTTANDIPNTVVFSYDVNNVEADSFFIQQSWDRNRRVRIEKGNHTLTDIYYEPGYHIAKLIADDSVISTFDISIPTDRWFFFAKDNPSANPEYISAANPVASGTLSITEQDLQTSKIQSDREKAYCYTYFPSTIDASSDNYVLKTRVRTRQLRADFCPYILLEIFTQRYTMFFKSTSKGCSSESMLQFGPQFVNGKDNDLSALGFDVTQWTDLEVRVNDRKVSININGETVYRTAYDETSGLITGLGFVSNGLCEVDSVEMQGTDGSLVYESRFDAVN
jgi:hypothetical protein